MGIIHAALLPGGIAGVELWDVACGLSKSSCLGQQHIGAISADDTSEGLKRKDPTEIL